MFMRICGSALLLAMTGAASPAIAVTVDFDSVASGTVIAEQYVSSGVRFIGSFGVTSSTFGGAVTPPSPPNFVQVARVTAQIVRFVDPARPSGRATTGSVSVDTPALSGGCYDAIEMEVFDADGVLIDSTVIPAVAPATPKFTTTLAALGIHEVHFIVTTNNCIAPFDNLVFDAVVPVDIFSDGFEGQP